MCCYITKNFKFEFSGFCSVWLLAISCVLIPLMNAWAFKKNANFCGSCCRYLVSQCPFIFYEVLKYKKERRNKKKNRIYRTERERAAAAAKRKKTTNYFILRRITAAIKKVVPWSHWQTYVNVIHLSYYTDRYIFYFIMIFFFRISVAFWVLCCRTKLNVWNIIDSRISVCILYIYIYRVSIHLDLCSRNCHWMLSSVSEFESWSIQIQMYINIFLFFSLFCVEHLTKPFFILKRKTQMYK